MFKHIMTVEQLAEYLQLNPQTVYRKAQTGEIPSIRIGKILRFKKDIIDAWLKLSSLSWGEKERKKLYQWAEKFSESKKISEEDVLRVIKKHRAKG